MCHMIVVRALVPGTTCLETKVFERVGCPKFRAGIPCELTDKQYHMDTTSWADILSGKVPVGINVYPTPTSSKTSPPLPKLRTTTPPPTTSPPRYNMASPRSPFSRTTTTPSPMAYGFGKRTPPTPMSQSTPTPVPRSPGISTENIKGPSIPASPGPERQPYSFTPRGTKEKQNAKETFIRPSNMYDVGSSPTSANEAAKPSRTRDPLYRFQEDPSDESAVEEPVTDSYQNYNASESQDNNKYTTSFSQSSTKARNSFSQDDGPAWTKDREIDRAAARERTRRSASKSVEPAARESSLEDKKRRRRVRRRRNLSYESNSIVNDDSTKIKSAAASIDPKGKDQEAEQRRKSSTTSYTDDDESLGRPKKSRARNL